jgi:hypothetical protein
MGKLGRATVAIGMLIGVLSLGAPADAHQEWTRIRGPGGQVVRGDVRGDHGLLWVCDLNPDSIGVWVEYYLTNGNYGVFTDGNGANRGCGGTDNFWNAGLSSFQAHSRDGGATGWIPISH